MTIESDEIRIENLEAKLTLAEKNLEHLLVAIKERERRENFGIINPDRKKELIEKAQFLANRIQELEKDLNRAIDVAGLPPEKREDR